jgi:nitrogen fixation NifU-like protein
MAGLEDLYREIILDHYRNPRNRGELSVPPAHRVEGFNPLCGDEIHLFVDVEDGTVADIKVSGQGCSISQSSASMMSAAVKGKPSTSAPDRAGVQGDDVDPRARPRRRRRPVDDESLDEVKLGDLERLAS